MTYTSEELRNLIKVEEAAMRRPSNILLSQGGYEIVRVLGEGGMGITCLANAFSANNLTRPVVLKFVKDSMDPQRLSQFLNEVQLAIRFDHPNLLPVYRLETEEIMVESARTSLSLGGRRRKHQHTAYYAVMQFVDGWNLRRIVERLRELRIVLNYDITMLICGQVARGLHYVHEYRDPKGNEHLGLVHRDVSPENILIDRFGRIKVADFGIARATNRHIDDGLLRAGNPLYCSPEQLDGAEVDRRSDIYNIGLIMYFLLTNRDRFASIKGRRESRALIREKMRHNPMEELSHVEELFARICDVCLRERPEERFQTCEDLANNIDIYFQDRQKVVTNEQLEEMLNDLFSPQPTFESRRFIPLTGSSVLQHINYDPGTEETMESQDLDRIETLKLDEVDIS